MSNFNSSTIIGDLTYTLDDNLIYPNQLCLKLSEAENLGVTCGITKINISLQAFILTFLAEWGDRSQIATIAVCSIFR